MSSEDVVVALAKILSPDEMRANCERWRASQESLAFVPTMGALHEGHMSLALEAKKIAQRTVVSIFVNPLQFGPKEDFATYPRTLEHDVKMLGAIGVDALFLPNARDVYPDGFQTYVRNEAMSSFLCGQHRPGHFQGVLTVVAKLFHIVSPDFALFGKKDYQQFRLIEKMAKDLSFRTKVLGLPTVREKDGLAMSSRNAKLTSGERAKAAQIYAGLKVVRDLYDQGERRVEHLAAAFVAILARVPELRLEYFEIRYQENLDSVPHELNKRPAVALVAAHLGSVRLIDNLELS